jgi:molybdate transport system ATP-binding protein
MAHDPEKWEPVFGQDHAQSEKGVSMLTVAVDKQLGDFALKASFEADGATALFGPSGAGKTSLINMIAGLLTPDRGRVVLDGEALFDADKRVNVPAWRRRVGYVFQEGRLFPHLSVKHNLDYGRWISGRAADPKIFAHVVELLDIGRLLDRRPGKLSGGERQRVAVGRALLLQPRLLLLDEPLASLDDARKAEILPYLERLRDEAALPMIYVSHNPAEVRRMARRVIMLEDGRVTATGGTELVDASQRDSERVNHL